MPALLHRARRRLRPALAARERYDAFRAHVEPDLLAVARVHRFAAPPLIGDARTPPRDLAVAIDTTGVGDATATRDSLRAQTVAPVTVAEGPPGEALAGSDADWVAIVPAGDRLAPAALERLGQALTLAPWARVLTCDDDLLGRAGERCDPRCGPGPGPETLASTGLHGPAVVVARAAAFEGVGRGAGAPGQLASVLAGPDAGGHGHVPQILFHRLRRAQPDLPGPPRSDASPSVEAIVCFRDRPALLRRCATALLERTAWDRLTLRLVDNGSSEAGTAEEVARLQRDPRVTATSDPGPFNFAALNNRAAAASDADVLLFVNNDIEVEREDWLEAVLAQATRAEIGAAGPLLTYPNGRVQHAGVALGMHGFAGHPYAGLRPDERTPFGTAAGGTRNWLAVTAACMAVERHKFERVGGFDEGFAVGGNDVDLCLRLTAAGYRSVCVTGARVVHDESASRDPAAVPESDRERSRQRYGEFRTIGDPFYNPALTLDGSDCSLRTRAPA